MSAAHNFGTSQWFLTLCSLPEWNQCWHIWKQENIRGGEWQRQKCRWWWRRTAQNLILIPPIRKWVKLDNIEHFMFSKIWIIIGSYITYQDRQLFKSCLVLQSQSHVGQIQPVWCSWHRSHCSPWSWPEFCPVVRSHRQSYPCRKQLEGKQSFQKTQRNWRLNNLSRCPTISKGWSLF